MTYQPRAITGDELLKIHSDQQYSKVKCLFVPQPELFRALLNGAPSSNDSVKVLNYDNVTVGDYTKLIYGMTLYVYSTSGSYAGMVRIRSASATQITIGRCSDISWTDNMILSGVEDFGYWTKLPYKPDEETIWMDDDVPYGNDNVEMRPVPIMGPDRAMPLSAGSIALDGSESYTLDGSAITSYSWRVSTSGSQLYATSGSAGAFGNFTFPGTGLYRLELTIQTSYNRVTTGRRTLYVYDDNTLEDQLHLLSMGANTSDGGWTAQIELWEDADLSLVKDRTKVFLIAQDYYNGTAQSIGQITGQEQVLMVGWIDGDSILYDREISSVKFDIQGGNFWMDKLASPSTMIATISHEVDEIEVDINTWLFFQDITPVIFIHHFCLWHSTVMEIMDIQPSPTYNNVTMSGVIAGIGSIWSQINTPITSQLLMRLGVDRYNRLFIIQDPQLLPIASRAGITVIQAITGDDLSEKVDIKRIVTSPVAMVEIAAFYGVQVDYIYMSRAPGSLVYKRYGESKTYDRCIVNTQEEANELAGNLLAKNNNEYPEINVTLGENNRMFDIAPAMYGTITVTAAQNARGIALDNLRVLPKRIDYKIDPEKGFFTVEMAFEGETSGPAGVTVDMQTMPIYNIPPQPDFPVIDVPLVPIPNYEAPGFSIPNYINPYYNNPNIVNPKYTLPTYLDPFIPRLPIIQTSGSSPCATSEPANGPYHVNVPTGDYYPTDTDRTLNVFRVRLRSSGHTNKTRYELTASFQKANSGGVYSYTADDNWYNVYGCNASGSRIATFTHDAVSGSTSGSASTMRTGYWNGSVTDIEYIEIGLTGETPFRPATVTYPTFSEGGGFQNSPSIMGTITWGYSQSGIWIRHQNSSDNSSVYNQFGNPMWLMHYHISGSAVSYAGKWFRIGFQSHKRSVSFPNALQYPGETGVQAHNWMLYQCFIGDIYGGSGRVVGNDTRTPLQVVSGSIMAPNTFETNVQNQTPTLIVSHRKAVKEGEYVIAEDDLLITIKPMPTYKMTIGKLNIYNVCNPPRVVIGTAAVDVGVGE